MFRILKIKRCEKTKKNGDIIASPVLAGRGNPHPLTRVVVLEQNQVHLLQGFATGKNPANDDTKRGQRQKQNFTNIKPAACFYWPPKKLRLSLPYPNIFWPLSASQSFLHHACPGVCGAFCGPILLPERRYCCFG